MKDYYYLYRYWNDHNFGSNQYCRIAILKIVENN